MESVVLRSATSRAWWFWSIGAIGALVLAAVSGGVFWTSLRMEQARYLVDQSSSRSLEAIVSATQLESAIVDRQRVARGFVISRGSLDPFVRTEGSAETSALALRAMVSADPVQARRADALGRMVAQQTDRIDRVRAEVSGGDFADAVDTVTSGEGDRSLAKARMLIGEIVATERLNLVRTRALAIGIESQTELYTYAIGMLGLLVVVLAGMAVMVSVSSSWKARVGDIQRRLDDEAVSGAQMMRLAHEATGAGTWDADGGDGRLRWSNEMHLLYGRHSSLGVPSLEDWRAMVHPDDVDACPWTSGAILDGGSFERTFRVATPSGRWRHVVSRGFAHSRDGVTRIVGMDVDVTEQIENRDELRRLNDLLVKAAASDRFEREIVFEATSDVMALVGPDGVVVSANPAWKSVLDLDPTSVVGSRIADLAFLGSEWNGEGSFSCRMAAADGSARDLEWSLSMTSDGRTVAAGRDVTLQREADHRLRSAEDAVRQMQKIETIGEMTGGVAHDINNMLTPIVGFLDLLNHRHRADEKSARMINMAMQSADKAKTLVSKLLSFARRQQLEYRVVDAGDLVRGMHELIEKSVAASSVEVSIDADEGASCVRVDPNQFEMVLMNLAVNARDAMPHGGRIGVTVRRTTVAEGTHRSIMPAGEYVVVAVQDAGVGMDAAVLSRAVEPFYSTKGLGKGTGLGLSMAHGMAAQSGGSLVLESEVGIGTTASVWLPQVHGDLLAPSSSREPSHSGTVERRLRIILVDDEDLVRASIEQMLIGLGHEVVTASSGAQALSMIALHDDFDVLVTDYLMPSMTGGELVSRAREIHTGLPAVIVSGYTSVADQVLTSDVVKVPKPFTSVVLQRALEKAMPADAVADEVASATVVDIRSRR